MLLQVLSGTTTTPDWLNQDGWQVDNLRVLCEGKLDAQHYLGPGGAAAGFDLSVIVFLGKCIKQPAPPKVQVTNPGKHCRYVDGVPAAGF